MRHGVNNIRCVFLRCFRYHCSLTWILNSSTAFSFRENYPIEVHTAAWVIIPWYPHLHLPGQPRQHYWPRDTNQHHHHFNYCHHLYLPDSSHFPTLLKVLLPYHCPPPLTQHWPINILMARGVICWCADSGPTAPTVLSTSILQTRPPNCTKTPAKMLVMQEEEKKKCL